MDYRELGNNGLKVTSMAFGAWAIGGWLWGGADHKDAVNAVREALDLGMTSIDTAAAYGFGRSEEIIAEAVRGRRHQVQIFTKYGLVWDKEKGNFFFHSKDDKGRTVAMHRYAGKESVMQECDSSLKRLRTDYIDLYQIHWPDETTPVSDTMEAIDRLLGAGKILAAGVCNYTVEQLAEARRYVNIVSNQVPYSMLNRKIETDLLPYCRENNVSVLAYSPLQRGLLTGKFKPGHVFNEGDSRPDSVFYREPNFSRIIAWIEHLRPIADARGVTIAQIVLAWTLRQPGITVTLAGARNAEQVRENVGVCNLHLTNEETAAINARLDELKLEL